VAEKDQSAGRRLSTITVDQIIAGASNVLIAVLAARVLGVGAFGLFGIVFVVYATAQGASRALVCEPLLVHPREAEERPGDVLGTSLLLGLGIGAIVAGSGGISLFWDGGLGWSLILLGIFMPLLVWQDLGRYYGFAMHRPTFSLMLDSVWLVLVFIAMAALLITDHKSLPWFVLGWAGTGAISGILTLFRLHSAKLRLSLDWLRETWSVSWRYLISFGALQGAALVASIGFGALAGAKALGALRGAQLLQRPIVTVQAASIAAGVAEVARMDDPASKISRHVRRTTGLTVLVALANLAVLVFLPDVLGRAVLGDTWSHAKPLLLPASLQMVLLAMISGTRSALLGLKKVRITVRIDVVSVVLLVVLPLIGVARNGALGAYWGYALAQAIVTLIWTVVYLRTDRKVEVLKTPRVDEPVTT